MSMFLWLFCLMLSVCSRWLAKMLATRSRVNKYATGWLPRARVELFNLPGHEQTLATRNGHFRYSHRQHRVNGRVQSSPATRVCFAFPVPLSEREAFCRTSRLIIRRQNNELEKSSLNRIGGKWIGFRSGAAF